MTESPTPTRTDSPPETAAWRELALKVLESVSTNAVHCGTVQVEELRRVVNETVSGLRDGASASQALVSAGVLSQAIAHYSGQTQREVDAMRVELNSTLQIFLEHFEQLYPEPAPQGLVMELRELVESSIEAGSLGAAHDDVAAKLKELSAHADEKRQRMLEMSENLKDRVAVLQQPYASRLPAPPAVSGALDPVTGLPGRMEAEEALRCALADSTHGYAVIFYLHRMQLTNARFGEAIGNQVILFCSQHVATNVTRGNDLLFRWSGPAFVAILERHESAPNVAVEIQRIISAPLSRFFETPSRSVYLPIKLTAAAISLAGSNFAEVSDAIERFVLQASGGGNEN